MRKNALLIVSYICFLTTFSTYTLANKSIVESRLEQGDRNPLFSIVNAETFSTKYSNLNWMHIGRLKNANPDIDLHNVTVNTDWKAIIFNHDKSKSFAYRLYDGNYLIILVK